MTQVTDFSRPTEVNDVEMAFPANALDYMPERQVCEAALKELPPEQEKKWREFQYKWFFEGLSKRTKVSTKKGIDGKAAFRHLKVIQGSYTPSHEHKEAAVAYLASLWFKDVKYR